MRVAYDSRPARTWNGVGRYAACLLDALGASRLGEVVETREPRRGQVFHSPWIEGAPLRSPVPSVVTLHDLVPLKRPGDYLRTGLRFKLCYLAVQRATMVIVPTRTVAEDAMRVLDIPADRIEVIPEAAAPAFRRRSAEEVAVVRERYGLPDRYLLWVGSMRRPDPRKRVAALARAGRSMPLVLVGPVSRWARELPGVQVTGAVPDDELAAIYSGAHALVFPSEAEGFALPPVEALACGTPVAACDVPALREVLGGRVTLSDLDDLDALVRHAEGLSRPVAAPPQWSWDDVAVATWEVYERALLLGSPGRRPSRAAERSAGGAGRGRPD